MLNLRDTLLNSLKSLPGSREFHIHVLVSAPRKTQDLFPYAIPRPRTWIQDIVILVSEQANADSPTIFVTGVEAYFYIVPITNSGILYVSKVDSTGQGKKPSPTATIVRTLIHYYLDPETRPSVGGGIENFWVHVFARAQNQYLFPNSAEFVEKKPLSDVRLCGWWKSILTCVARELKRGRKSRDDSTEGGEKQDENKLTLWYLLPGFSDLEASHALDSIAVPAEPNPASIEDADLATRWIYGHPYASSQPHGSENKANIQLPCPVDSRNKTRGEEGLNLGHFIPSFEDDPKSRFMDEIAHTSEWDVVRSPVRKKSTKIREDDVGESKDRREKDGGGAGQLCKVSPDEFWERMSFRQECVAGVVTGYFVLGFSMHSKLPLRRSVDSAGPSSDNRSSISIFAPRPGHVSSSITTRVLRSLLTGHEFSTVERAIRGTETLEKAIKGLCEGVSNNEADPPPLSQDHSRRTPEPADRPSWLTVPPQTPPRNTTGRSVLPEVSPNPFPEPNVSLETYESWIYGTVCIDNPVSSLGISGSSARATERPDRKEKKVTILTVRKKRKLE